MSPFCPLRITRLNNSPCLYENSCINPRCRRRRRRHQALLPSQYHQLCFLRSTTNCTTTFPHRSTDTSPNDASESLRQQLSQDWFPLLPLSLSSSASYVPTTTQSTAPVTNDGPLKYMVNVHGFLSYLEFWEQQLRHVVEITTTTTTSLPHPDNNCGNSNDNIIKNGGKIIHALLCCALLHVEVLQLSDIVSRVTLLL
jgi:hypothetical protein